jgi:hypothetical protein
MNKFRFILLGIFIILITLFGKHMASGYFYSGTESYNVLSENNSYFSKLVNLIPMDYSFMIPLIFGVLSLLVLILILEKLNFSDDLKNLSLVLLVCTPIWIYTYTNLISLSLSFLLILITALLYLSKNNFYYLSLFFVLFLSPVLFIVSVLFIAGYDFIFKKRPYVLFMLPLVLLNGYNLFFMLIPRDFSLFSLFIEFGFLNSLSFVSFGLGIIGLMFFWKRSAEYIYISIFSFFMIILASFYFEFLIILSLIFAVSSASFILYLLEKKWYVETIKFYTLLLIFCAYLFVLISFVNYSVTENNDKFEALEFLSTKAYGTVLSVENNGFLINYITENEVFVDENSYKYRTYNNKLEYMDNVFYSVRFSEIKELFSIENIRYVFVDSDMLEGDVWSSKTEGLIFVAENSGGFSKIYDNNGIIIYEILS